MKYIRFVACLVCTLSIGSAAHAAEIRTVALSGQQVPGAPDGTIFGSFSGLSVSQPPVLNDAGQTAFYASASNLGEGIWSEAGGSLSLVAAVGQQAPGMPDGVTYGHFGERLRILISDAGLTAFGASVIEPGVSGNVHGIWSSGPGGSALVALSGQQAAGMLYGLDDLISLRTFLFNDAGQVAFQALLSDGRGILAQRQGNLELVAHTGSHAPGTPDGVNFSGFGNIAEFTLNKTGQTAFYGGLTGSGVDATNDVGVWSEGSGSLALVARKGSQAPGMPDGAVFNPLNSIFRPDLNNAGQTAFASFVTGGGVDATNNSGIWLGTAGSLSLAVRTGDPAPGAPSGVTFAILGSLALNDAGQIAITAGLTEPGAGLWSGAPGSLALVARTGEHAPGTEDGVVFGGFTSTSAGQTLILNAAGQTAFVGRLSGSGISASNDLGIWATDRSGALQLIAREGDPLEVAPGDFRTVRELYFISRRANPIYPTGNSDGRPSAFNNWGQLAFQAQFTDGTGGIFVSNRVAVPEPNTLLLLCCGSLAVLWRRRGLFCASALAAAFTISIGDRAAADTFGSGVNTFDIEFVTIGNPGNAADTTGNPNPAGSVPYNYRMGKFEISEQMIEKANAEGGLGITKDTRGADKPATSTSWNEAARFVNWLNTSSGSPPAYKFALQPGEVGYIANVNIELWTISDAGYSPNNLYRNSLARYFLPNVDEWYKAAYYDPTSGVYYDYPTGSNAAPTPVASGTAAGTAVYNGQAGPADITLAGGLSPYGMMGQGGNVHEWEETDLDLVNGPTVTTSARGVRGNYWGQGSLNLLSSRRLSGDPTSGEVFYFGFRVASSIPEPSTLLLLCFGSLAALWRRRRLVCAPILVVLIGISSPDHAKADTFGSGANTFEIEFVTIGNPGNAADTTGNPNPAGSVSYTYNMGKFEVSRDMITKANTLGSLGITLFDMTPYGGNGVNRPATGVSWNEAARFVNWLNISQGFTPAYKFRTQPGDGGYGANQNIALWVSGDAGFNAANPFRNSQAHYFLPSVDEWYKAAYYDPTAGVYYNYPTGSDSAPTPVASGTAAGTAVYGQTFATGPADITLAGGLSSYGTMAQGGNVIELEETEFDLVNNVSSSARGIRGGSWVSNSNSSNLSSSSRVNDNPTDDDSLSVGFRVASIPEPSTLLLLCFGSLAVLWRRRGLVCVAILVAVVGIGFADRADAVTIDMVTVGNPGNAPDTRYNSISVGSVGNVYQIGKYEVTAGQYTEFLNAVAKDDPNGLYSTEMGDPGPAVAGANIQRSGSSPNYTYSIAPDWANRPVNYVNFWDTARFANWLHNGQPTGAQGPGTTEGGAYINVGNQDTFARQPGARFFIPTEDEWYKAAYHDKAAGLAASYFDFPTGTNSWPGNDITESTNPGNNANCYIYENGGYAIGLPYYRTEVGEFEFSDSPYGTFDQGGNVYEWNETSLGPWRGIRGGLFGQNADILHASTRGVFDHLSKDVKVGFRVATVPEPDDLGDYNHDDFVDAADYVVLRKNSGTSEEFDIWRTSFGTMLANGSAITVPEPNTLLLLCFGSLAVLWRRRSLVCATILAAVVGIGFADRADAVTIDTVPVGNPGNAADTRYDATGFGAVGANYRIGTTEVTNAQYVEFLNGVATSDPYQLYNTSMGDSTWGGITRSDSSGSYTYAVKVAAMGQGPGGTDYSYGDKPVVFVSWFDSIRFANWLHNGMGSGDTENGAYTLLGGTPTPSNGNSITRNPGARWWLPSEDEWYKAAYYDRGGVYYDYPTATSSEPNNNLPSADTGNSANFYDNGYTTGNFSYPITDAGAYALSDSPYGTFDQGGNVWEWNETLVASSLRGYRGGSWGFLSNSLPASNRLGNGPAVEGNHIGFRVASIPEPSTLLLLCFGSLAVLWRRRTRNG